MMLSWLKCKSLVKNLMSTTATDEVPAVASVRDSTSRDHLPVLPELLGNDVSLSLSATDVVVSTSDVLVRVLHEIRVGEIQGVSMLCDEGLGSVKCPLRHSLGSLWLSIIRHFRHIWKVRMNPHMAQTVHHARVHHEPEARALAHGATDEWVDDALALCTRCCLGNPIDHSNVGTWFERLTRLHRFYSEMDGITLLLFRVDCTQRLECVGRDYSPLYFLAHRTSSLVG